MRISDSLPIMILIVINIRVVKYIAWLNTRPGVPRCLKQNTATTELCFLYPQPQQNCVSSTLSSLSHFSTGAVIHLVFGQAKCLGVSIVSNFPGVHSKELACQSRGRRRRKFDPWLWKIPWRRAWPPTPVFLPGESHGRRSLAGCSPQGHKESDKTEHSHTN